MYKSPETGKTSGKAGCPGQGVMLPAVAGNLAGGKGKGAMISFLEMVQRYPIGAKVDLPKQEGRGGTQEVVGYEYYNGSGFLVFGDEERVNVEQLSEKLPPKLY